MKLKLLLIFTIAFLLGGCIFPEPDDSWPDIDSIFGPPPSYRSSTNQVTTNQVTLQK